MKIKTDQLEILFRKVVSKLKELEIDSVELNQDYYWLISNEDWTKIEEESKPIVGSLMDDWDNLKKVSLNDQPMMFVDFDRLASILRAISEKLNSEKR